MLVERNRKEAPAAKRRNCFRERGETSEEDGGGVDDSLIVGKVEGWRSAMPDEARPLADCSGWDIAAWSLRGVDSMNGQPHDAKPGVLPYIV